MTTYKTFTTDHQTVSVTGRATAALGVERPIERVALNTPDDYPEVEWQLDLAHGCGIVTDIVGDVAADAIADAVGDVAADAAADVAGDAAGDAVADATADLAADTAADVGTEAAAEAIGEAVAEATGETAATASRWVTLAKLLGLSVVTVVVNHVMAAIKAAEAASPAGGATTSADYWNSLLKTMTQSYPCDVGSASSCPGQMRATQEAMIIQFANVLSTKNPAAGQASLTFPAASQAALKQSLNKLTANGGIPTLVKYMASYTNPSLSGAALVIAGAQVLTAVASFAYTD